MGQAGAGGADHAEDVDVEDVAPFLVGVGLHGAPGPDAGVVDQDVEAAQVVDGRGHRRAHGGVVGDVGAVSGERLVDRRRVEVEDGHHGATVREQVGGGPADAGGAAGHQGRQALEFAHAVCSLSFWVSGSAAQKPPSG